MSHRAIKWIREDIMKPALNKHQQWRAVKLKNDMQVLIISDENADQSAAAMNVGIGTLSDPEELPGLAHFCEHMSFLGSHKYPSETSMFDVVTPHGGKINAYTDAEDTNFHFDVDPRHFKEALDVFAQLFISPLFTESAARREINAVNNEFLRYLTDDRWRLLELEKSLSRSGHPYRKFMTGNIDSLGSFAEDNDINICEALLKFHTEYYSPNIMCLAIHCQESLDDMTNYICDLFGDMVNKHVIEPSWPEHPYGPEQVRRRVFAVPVKDLQQLHLIWPCEDMTGYWQSKGLPKSHIHAETMHACNIYPRFSQPGSSIGHLLGHKGAGSLLSKLKMNGWVDDLSAGTTDSHDLPYGARGFGFFKLIAKLTEEGLDHVDEIITAVYQYIQLIKQLCDPNSEHSLFEELELMSKVDFTYKDEKKPVDMVQHLSECLKRFPTRDVMSGPFIWRKFQPGVLIDCLKPENMMSLVFSKAYAGETDMTEKWYGVEYTIRQHSNKSEHMWRNPKLDSDLFLPKPNELIPKSFTMSEQETPSAPYPRIIKNSSMMKCWFKQDSEFSIPKGCITLAFTSPHASDKPTHESLLWLMIEIFKDDFLEYSYSAELANISYKVNQAHYGFELQLCGYTQKMKTFLEKILCSLTSIKINKRKMTIMKEKYRQYLTNRREAEPAERASTKLETLLSKICWSEDELLESMCDLTADQLTSFIPEFFSRIHIEALVFGNYTEESATSLISIVETTLTSQMQCKPLNIHAPSRGRAVVHLPFGSSYTYNETNEIHQSSSVYNYYQFNAEDYHHAMLLELLHQVIKDPCYDQLRTQEQLGYRVRAEKTKADGVLALLVLVQSHMEPEFVNQRIESFLTSFVEHLQNMPEEHYQQHVSGLVSARVAKAKNLLDQNTAFWSEIVNQLYDFDRSEMEILFLRKITKQELIQCFLERFELGAAMRRKLSVRIVCRNHIETSQTISEVADMNNNNDVSRECGIVVDKILSDAGALKKETRFFNNHKPVVVTSGS